MTTLAKRGKRQFRGELGRKLKFIMVLIYIKTEHDLNVSQWPVSANQKTELCIWKIYI